MLDLRNLTVRYGNKTVLHGVNATLPAQGITVLLGKNGIGKSTLLSAIAGILPYEGEILLGNEPLRGMDVRERAKRIALLPQRLKAPSVSVRELVGYGRTPHIRFPYRLKETDQKAVDDALRRTNTEALAYRDASTLSGGELARVHLAMTLAQDTPVLLLDEPFASIDAEGVERLSELLRTLVKEGRTVLLTAHDPSLAVRIADHLMVFRAEGEIFSGTREQALTEEIIEKALGVKRYVALGEKEAIFFA